jgi:hypothetical protein
MSWADCRCSLARAFLSAPSSNTSRPARHSTNSPNVRREQAIAVIEAAEATLLA